MVEAKQGGAWLMFGQGEQSLSPKRGKARRA